MMLVSYGMVLEPAGLRQHVAASADWDSTNNVARRKNILMICLRMFYCINVSCFHLSFIYFHILLNNQSAWRGGRSGVGRSGAERNLITYIPGAAGIGNKNVARPSAKVPWFTLKVMECLDL